MALLAIGYKILYAYSESCQTFKMECFAKIVKAFQPATILAKRYILDL